MNFLRLHAFILVLIFISHGSALSQKHKAYRVRIIDTTHYSKIFDEVRNYRIFLPPEYDSQPEKRYPVIYYFHGYAGRFNGPAEGIQSQTAESRYYDEFNGNFSRCGPDSLDNFAEYVRTHDVIIAKWDGYVKTQYPRPYDVGPVKDNLQFALYFPEFVQTIDRNFRTIASREGRAVSGLSMGGFMSLFIASKYPHLISSASFFNPAVGFAIGPRKLQVYTPFDEMGKCYVGLPIRMHIGMRDFLRQHNLDAYNKFNQLELFFESWHYGINYFNGYHYVVNVEGQFDFHMKHFRLPSEQPPFWYHTDVYPDFEIWGYRFKSDRKAPGYTVINEACRQGMKITTKRWLPDGISIPETNIKVTTEAIYKPDTDYHMVGLGLDDLKVFQNKLSSDNQGKVHFEVSGAGTDVGIFKDGDPGFISVPDYHLGTSFPRAWEQITLTPILFNKGGKVVDLVEAKLVSLNQDLEIIEDLSETRSINPGEISDKIKFKIRARAGDLDMGNLKLVLNYNNQEYIFLLDIPFYSSKKELNSFEIADGRIFKMDTGEEIRFGKGNGDGIANPGELISILTQSDLSQDCWYGLKLYSDDQNIVKTKENQIWSLRDTYIGNMRPTSEVFIHPDCPDGHTIKFQGKYDFQKRGNPAGNFQASQSFVHETQRVSFKVRVKQ